MDAQSQLFAGVDVGGTNIKIGLVDDSGQVLAKTSFPTDVPGGPQRAMQRCGREIRRLVEDNSFCEADIRGIGLGTPGSADIPQGLLLDPPNLPGWGDFPVRAALAQATGNPVTFTNDANAAAFGEYWVGGGRHASSVVLITLGTGVGGGIIVDGLAIQGAHSHGAEIGHMTIDSSPAARQCACGGLGHLEAYVSATALVARTRESLPQFPDSTLHRRAARITARDVADAASAQGDPFACELVDQTAAYLARGIALVAHVIDPEVFILGGAMNFGGVETPLGRKFLDNVTAQVRQATFPLVAENLKINYAQLGSDAGFVGAAGLSRADWFRQTASTVEQQQHGSRPAGP